MVNRCSLTSEAMVPRGVFHLLLDHTSTGATPKIMPLQGDQPQREEKIDSLCLVTVNAIKQVSNCTGAFVFRLLNLIVRAKSCSKSRFQR